MKYLPILLFSLIIIIQLGTIIFAFTSSIYNDFLTILISSSLIVALIGIVTIKKINQ